MKKWLAAMVGVMVLLLAGLAGAERAGGLYAENIGMPAEGLMAYETEWRNDSGNLIHAWGYHDLAGGGVAIPPQFSEAGPFAPNGLALVKDLAGAWHFINREGQVCLTLDYPVQHGFGESGYALMENRDGQLFLVDQSGNVVREGSDVNALCAGLTGDSLLTGYAFKVYTAKSSLSLQQYYPDEGIAQIYDWKQKTAYLMDGAGNRLTSGQYASICHYRDGLARVGVEVNGESLYGYVDAQENLVIPCTWLYASCFAEGRACVSDGERMYIIDVRGNVLEQSPRMKLRAVVGFCGIAEEGDQRYLVDITGEKIVPYSITSRMDVRDACEELVTLEVCGGCPMLVNSMKGTVAGGTYGDYPDYGETLEEIRVEGYLAGYSLQKNGLLYAIDRKGNVLGASPDGREYAVARYEGMLHKEVPEEWLEEHRQHFSHKPESRDTFWRITLSNRNRWMVYTEFINDQGNQAARCQAGVASIGMDASMSEFWMEILEVVEGECRVTDSEVTVDGYAVPDYRVTGTLKKTVCADGTPFATPMADGGLVGAWEGRNVTMLFREDGTFRMETDGAAAEGTYVLLDEETVRVTMRDTYALVNGGSGTLEVPVSGEVAVGDMHYDACTLAGSGLSLTRVARVQSTGLRYAVKDGKVTITSCQEEAAEVVIPATLDGYPVTAIAAEAFRDCKTLKRVEIADSVMTIGQGAFYGCKALRDVVLPAGLTEIRQSTFYDCQSLSSVTIPAGVTVIGNYAFENCIALASVTLPESLTDIGAYAFDQCRSLEELDVPDSAVSLGECAFQGCSSLRTVTLPAGMTTIGNYAFEDCRALTDITLPTGMVFIGPRALWGCKALANVYVAKNSHGYFWALEHVNSWLITPLESGDGAAQETLTADMLVGTWRCGGHYLTFREDGSASIGIPSMDATGARYDVRGNMIDIDYKDLLDENDSITLYWCDGTLMYREEIFVRE